MMRTRRVADGAKWAELFGKAVREEVEVRQTGSGLWIATSGTDRTAAYVVSLPECECPGHTYHGYCKHRAMLAWTPGVLTLAGDARARTFVNPLRASPSPPRESSNNDGLRMKRRPSNRPGSTATMRLHGPGGPRVLPGHETAMFR